MLRCLVLMALVVPTAARAADRDPRRSGGGVRVGHWQLLGAGPGEPTLPLLEGYHATGMDRHIALDNSVSVWGRSVRSERREETLLGSNTVEDRSDAWLIPIFTGLRMHPFTGPEDSVEPLIFGGAGVVLIYEEREHSENGGDPERSSVFGYGVGVKGGLGVEARISRAFGAAVVAGYQWFYLLDELQSTRSLQGWTAAASLTYRFQD